MVISKWPDNAEALKIRFFCCRLGDCDKRVVLLRSRIVAYSMAAKALHSSNRSALMRMTGSDEAGSQSKNGARVYYIAWFCYI